jgi:hypothetical protein
VSKSLIFWVACAATLFVLSLVSFHLGVHRKNYIFAAWLCFSVAAQVVAAWGLALGRPRWFGPLGQAVALAGGALALAAIILGLTKFSCPVNRTVVMGLGGMLAVQILAMALARSPASAGSGHPAVAGWLRNVGFLGPALWMLLVFSGVRFDRLPILASRWFPAFAGMTRGAGAWARAILG